MLEVTRLVILSAVNNTNPMERPKPALTGLHCEGFSFHF